MKILYKFIVLSILLTTSLFATNIGTITLLKGNANINRDGTDIAAILGSKLSEKDIITTKEESKVQVVFNDQTVITIGKNSNFSINEYLFEDNKTPLATFSLLKGAVQTITGKIGKIAPQKFKIKTKTSTIGIRGTIFSVLVSDDGSTRVFCTFGEITVEINKTLITVPQGFYATVSSSGEISKVKEFTSSDLNNMKNENFTAVNIEKETLFNNIEDASSDASEAKSALVYDDSINDALTNDVPATNDDTSTNDDPTNDAP